MKMTTPSLSSFLLAARLRGLLPQHLCCPSCRYSASMPSLKALTSLFSCFQPVRLSTLIQRWAPLLTLIWPAH